MNRIISFILISLVISTFFLMLSKKEKKLKGLRPKFETSWERKEQFNEFSKKLGLPIIWPTGLIITEKYIYVSDFCRGIQILKLGLGGKISTISYFGKEYKDLKIFYATEQGLAVKGNYLYVADSGNHRLQIFKISPDGNIYAKSTFGKEGKGLGEFSSFGGLAVKGNYLYVADSGNVRMQVLELQY